MTEHRPDSLPDDADPGVFLQEFVLQVIPVTPDMKLVARRGRPMRASDGPATLPPAAEPPREDREPPAARDA